MLLSDFANPSITSCHITTYMKYKSFGTPTAVPLSEMEMKKKGIQILEEILLLVLAFVGIAIAITAMNKVSNQALEALGQIEDIMKKLVSDIFYWLPYK